MREKNQKKTDKNKEQAKTLSSIITEVWLTRQLPFTYAKLILLIKSLEECKKETHFDHITFNSFMFDVIEKDKLLDYVAQNINLEKINYDHKTFGYYWSMSLKIKPQEENALRYLAIIHHLIPAWFKKLKMNKEEEFSVELFLMQKTYEVIGYWTAKLEEMIRNQRNVKPRIDNKAKRKNELKEWMKTMAPAERHLKAMEKWKVTERTILLDEQELREESKTRNTKDILKLVTKKMEQEMRQYIEEKKIEEKNKMEAIKRNPKIYDMEIEKWETEKTAFLRKYTDIA